MRSMKARKVLKIPYFHCAFALDCPPGRGPRQLRKSGFPGPFQKSESTYGADFGLCRTFIGSHIVLENRVGGLEFSIIERRDDCSDVGVSQAPHGQLNKTSFIRLGKNGIFPHTF